jgi:hypothetical protein
MSRQTRMNLLSVAALSLLLFIALGTTKRGSKQTTTTNSGNQSQSTSGDVLSAEDLFAEYEANRDAANNKYKGKTLRVSGRIDTISSGPSGNSYVILKSNSSMFGIQCIFDGKSQALSDLRQGERATFRGEVFAKIGNVVLRHCEVQ